jgi:exportin-1
MIYRPSYETLQVCLDYWNVFVLELFEAHNQMEPAATVSMMGLQVLLFDFCLSFGTLPE